MSGKMKKLLKYTPRAIIDSRSRHRTMAPIEEYKNGFIKVAESCNALVDAGVRVCVGWSWTTAGTGNALGDVEPGPGRHDKL